MNYSERIEKVQNFVLQNCCEAFLIEDAINLYYLTGLSLSSGKFIISKREPILLVDNRYFQFCKDKVTYPVLLAEKNPLDQVLKDFVSLGFDSTTTTYQSFLNLKKTLSCQLIPLDNPILKIRSIKDPEEITILREAAALGNQGFYYIQSLLKEGVTEIEMAAELEIFWKRKGGQGVAFEPIIAFGKNGAMPHHRASETKLEKGMSVLIDIGVKWKKYHSDMTRTFFWGTVPHLQEIYSIVEEAHRRALELCKAGTLIGDLDAAARGYIASKGYGDQFLHSLGHGIGLEVHEWPLIRQKEPYQSLPLEKGMVITIEPGIYLPEIGGVRIEDTIVIEKNGFNKLT